MIYPPFFESYVLRIRFLHIHIIEKKALLPITIIMDKRVNFYETILTMRLFCDNLILFHGILVSSEEAPLRPDPSDDR
jgi:hypothetical protein